jgi:hypothetical protein
MLSVAMNLNMITVLILTLFPANPRTPTEQNLICLIRAIELRGGFLGPDVSPAARHGL